MANETKMEPDENMGATESQLTSDFTEPQVDDTVTAEGALVTDEPILPADDSSLVTGGDTGGSLEPARDSYFDEEDFAIESNDQEAYQTTEGAGYIQEHGSVVWTIDGTHDEKGKLKSARKLNSEPPVLNLETVDEEGNAQYMTFVLTKGFSQSLGRAVEDVNRQYYGLKPKDERSPKERLSESWGAVKAWVPEHKVATVFIALIVAFMVYGLIVSTL